MTTNPKWRAFDRARKRLANARSRAADDGMYPMRDTARRLAQSELRSAEALYESTRAAWIAAGRPGRNTRFRGKSR